MSFVVLTNHSWKVNLPEVLTIRFFFNPLAVFGSQAQAAQTAGSGLPLACGGAVAAVVVASQRTGPAAELVGCGKGKFWKEFAGWTELIAQR